MPYRSGTYIGFDGLGKTDPTQSDYRYYSTIQSWHQSDKIEFKFVNSHDKASSVRDSSKLDTLKASIRQRLAASKNMVIILSRDTRKTGSVLSWEIEQAVDRYELPLIIAYAGLDSVLTPSRLSNRWPAALSRRINDETACAIHVPFKRDALFDAIERFSVNGEKLDSPLTYYSEEMHRKWGYI